MRRNGESASDRCQYFHWTGTEPIHADRSRSSISTKIGAFSNLSAIHTLSCDLEATAKPVLVRRSCSCWLAISTIQTSEVAQACALICPGNAIPHPFPQFLIPQMRNAKSKIWNKNCGNGFGMVGKMWNMEKVNNSLQNSRKVVILH